MEIHNLLIYSVLGGGKSKGLTSLKSITLILLLAILPTSICIALPRKGCSAQDSCVRKDTVVVSQQGDTLVIKDAVGSRKQL